MFESEENLLHAFYELQLFFLLQISYGLQMLDSQNKVIVKPVGTHEILNGKSTLWIHLKTLSGQSSQGWTVLGLHHVGMRLNSEKYFFIPFVLRFTNGWHQWFVLSSRLIGHPDEIQDQNHEGKHVRSICTLLMKCHLGWQIWPIWLFPLVLHYLIHIYGLTVDESSQFPSSISRNIYIFWIYGKVRHFDCIMNEVQCFEEWH